MKNLLFVCYGGGHAAMLLPVIKILITNNSVNLTILALTTAKKFFDKHNIKTFGFSDYTFLVDSSFHTYGQKLVTDEISSHLVSVQESIAYHGINIIDLIAQFGEEEAFKAYSNHKRQSFHPINFMYSLLTFLKTDLVVATNSPRSEKAVINAAKMLCIPSVCLVDLFALQEYKWIANNNFGSKVCVLNETVSDFLISKGRNSSDIIVTGNPAFDEINCISNQVSGKNFKKSLGEEFRVIFFASQVEPSKHPFNDKIGDPTLPRKIEKSLRRFVKNNSNYKLLIRYHPSEVIKFVEQDRVLLADFELYDAIHASEIVVVMSSTVGLESYYAGKHVISIDCSIFTEDAPFSKMGISNGIKEIDDLPIYLSNLPENLSNTNNDSKHCSATDNVIKVLNQFINE